VPLPDPYQNSRLGNHSERLVAPQCAVRRGDDEESRGGAAGYGLIAVSERTVKADGVPLKLTAVVLVRSFPRTITSDPVLPELRGVSTKGPRPVGRLKAVPQPPLQLELVPPAKVVP
jgi:hypothetical protein